MILMAYDPFVYFGKLRASLGCRMGVRLSQGTAAYEASRERWFYLALTCEFFFRNASEFLMVHGPLAVVSLRSR
jgi:hypothetical protein